MPGGPVAVGRRWRNRPALYQFQSRCRALRVEMDCKQAHNLFDAYLDGELSSALATELGAHRLGCPGCRQELALMEVAGHVVAAQADEPALDDQFTDRLLACIEPTVTAPRKRRYRIIRIGVALAAAACLTIVVTLVSDPGEQVAGIKESGQGVEMPVAEAAPADPQPADAKLEDVTAMFQGVGDTVRETEESSTSLLRHGQMTMLELIDTIRLEILRDDGPQDAPPQDEGADDEADDVEDI